MRTILLLFAFSIVSCKAKVVTHIVTYYDNGSKESEIDMERNMKEGLNILYYENGQVKQKR